MSRDVPEIADRFSMNADVPMSMTSGSPAVRKPEGDRVGAERRPCTAERGDGRRRGHGVDDNQTGAGDHFRSSASTLRPVIQMLARQTTARPFASARAIVASAAR